MHQSSSSKRDPNYNHNYHPSYHDPNHINSTQDLVFKTCFQFTSSKIKTLLLIIGASAISFMIGCNYTFFIKSIYFNELKRAARYDLNLANGQNLNGRDFSLYGPRTYRSNGLDSNGGMSIMGHHDGPVYVDHFPLEESSQAAALRKNNPNQLAFRAPIESYQKGCQTKPELHPILAIQKSVSDTSSSSNINNRQNLVFNKRIAERFQKRRNFLQDSCQRFEIIPQCDNSGGFWPLATKTMIMDYPNHLTGCLVHKSASSSWHKVFWDLYAARAQLNNVRSSPDQSPIKFVPNIAYTKNYQRSTIKNVGQSNWVRALNEPNFIRFMTARHPLARLYSAWNHNLRKDGPMAASLFKFMRLSQYKIEIDPTHIISWNDFIRFFASNCIQRPNIINVHFRPISRQCGLCHRQIDYILKSETMDEDSLYLINLIKSRRFVEGESVVLPEVLEFGHRNKANNSLSESPEMIGEKFKNFGEGLMEPILEYYKLDLELLGYTYDIKTGKVGWTIEN